MESGGTNSTVVTWASPTRGVITCSGGVTYIVNVSTTSGSPIVQWNVKETNTTVDVELGAVTEVSIVVVSAIGNSKPGVWTPEPTTTTPGTSGEGVCICGVHSHMLMYNKYNCNIPWKYLQSSTIYEVWFPVHSILSQIYIYSGI